MLPTFTSRLRYSVRRCKPALLGLLLGSAPLLTQAAPFTPGNIVVVRVGDGSATLTSAATAVFLLEYTPAGTLVQTVALPTADAGSNQTLTNSGTAASDNNMTRSADGRYLVLTGYDAAPGTASITGTAAAATNRIIGRVAADGSIDTSTRIDDAFSATNFRSAASVDGSAFYAAGGNSGIRYLPLGNTGTTTALSGGAVVNFRAVNIFAGNLYVSSAANPNYGLNQVGTGLPTTAGQAVTLLPGFPTTSGPSSYGIYLTDLSAAVSGPDVAYVADDNTTGGIQKWSLVGGSWTLNGTIGGSTTALLRGLTGTTTGSAVTLVASGGGGLYSVADNAGYNAAPTTSALPAPFVTPAANTAFRGVAWAPLATALLARPAAVAGSVAVYPNPATAQLTVRLTELRDPASPVRLTLLNMLGQPVRQRELTAAGAAATVTLPLDGLAAGLYSLRLTTPSGQSVRTVEVRR